MAYGQVIQDSDDDGGISAGNSPSHAPTVALSGSIEAGTTLVQNTLHNNSGSTDPALFQQVYDEHFAAGESLSEHGQIETEHNAVEELISSPPIIRKKLKRSKTLNASSLTSVSEPTTSARKAKRSISMKDVEDLTQVTTPISRDPKERDRWEFPESSSSAQLSGANLASNDGKAQRSGALKTYGRPIRRSQTMVDIQSSPRDEWVPQPGFEEVASQTKAMKRSTRSAGDDNLLPMLPKPKRQKRGLSMRGDMLDLQAGFVDGRRLQVMQPAESALLDTSFESSSVIQVPRSTSEERPQNLRHSSPTQANESNAIIAAEPATISSEAETFETSVNSFAVIPDALTTSQKMQYDVISIASTIQSHPSSLPHMMDPVDLALKYTGDSSTVPNDTPAPKLSASAQTPKSLIVLSSSSPPNSETKARDFNIASKAPVSPSTSISSTNSQRIRRRKTIASGETNSYRESSIDELSLVAVEPLERPMRTATSKNGRAKTAKGVEQIDMDEFDEISMPEERYLPRPSLRRSKSAGAQKVDADADLSLRKPRTTRTKSAKIAKATSTPSQEAAVSDLNKIAAENPGRLDDPVQELDIPKHTEDGVDAKGTEVIDDDVSARDAATRNESFPTAPTVTQPRRQGRPRKSETNIQKFTQTPQPNISVDTANEVSEAEPAIIREADNGQLSPKIASPSQTADFILAKTPTKTVVETSTSTHTPTREAKKGPIEHSPLQCGKVSYRVGLSKKTRIAPLLKIIKK